MERGRLTPRETLRNTAISLILTGAAIATCSIWAEYYNAVKGVGEARKISIPNASSKELAHAISLQETKAINGALETLLLEQLGSLIVLGAGSVLYRATRDRQNGTQNQQLFTT